MKKRNFITVIAMIFSALIGAAQPPVDGLTGKELFTKKSNDNVAITHVINMSKQANLEKNGILNPDKIYPGQTLTFRFSNGIVRDYVVKTGYSQWKLVGEVLHDAKYYGPVKDFNEDGSYDFPTPLSSANDFPWFAVIAFVVLAYAILTFFIFKKEKEVRKDPTISGPPMRNHGVSDNEAPAYMQQVAQRQYGPQVQVRDIQKGMISGTNVAVFYAGETKPRRKTFTNIAGFRGVAMIGSTEEYIYFLQACGNDARIGNYFTGQNIQFIADLPTASPVIENATEQITEQVHEEQHAAIKTTKEVSASTDSEKEITFITGLAGKLTDKNGAKLQIETPSGYKVNFQFTGVSEKID